MQNKHAVILGSMGGKARAAKLSPERRKEIATKASHARKRLSPTVDKTDLQTS